MEDVSEFFETAEEAAAAEARLAAEAERARAFIAAQRAAAEPPPVQKQLDPSSIEEIS